MDGNFPLHVNKGEAMLGSQSVLERAGLSAHERALIRTALTAARSNDVPSVGLPTGTLERLIEYLVRLEEAVGCGDVATAGDVAPAG